jgi:hypothetical protein
VPPAETTAADLEIALLRAELGALVARQASAEGAW